MYLSQATDVITRGVPRRESLEYGILSLESVEVTVAGRWLIEKRIEF